MLRRSGLVLRVTGVLLLIFAVASGQIRPTQRPPSTRPTTIVPTHSTVPCGELAEYSQTYRNCDVYTNCSGTQCHLMQPLTGSTAKFWVEEKCADPVMVDLSVDGRENSFLNGYRGQFGVGGDGLGIHDPRNISANYGRNASHLTFRAMTFIDGDQALRLIPEIIIPLNPRQCMCASMRRIANLVQFPTQLPLINVGISCSPQADCTGLRCNTTIASSNYVSDVTIDPCGETVHVLVLDSDNATQIDQVFNDSGSYPFSIPAPAGLPDVRGSLDIGMVHHNYSMDLSINMRVSLSVVPESILPRQKIILDRSHCTNLTYYYANTTSAPSTTSAPPITTGGIPPATTHSPPLSNCLHTNAQNCRPTGNDCSGVQCNVQLSSSAPPVVATAEVKERCADPVMVNMSVTPSYQNMFSVPGDGLGSEVNIGGDSVRVEYGRNASHLHFKAIGSATLIPNVLIPLYPHQCMCQSMTNLANSFHDDDLSLIFGGTTTCSRRQNCDRVRCVAVGRYTSDVIVDPCQESVRISLQNTTSGDVVFDHSFPQSAEYPLPVQVSGQSPKLNVSIVHSNYSMKLSMEVIVNLLPNPIVLLSPQRIILDRTNCVNPPYYYSEHPGDTTPSSGSPSPSPGGHGGGGGSSPSGGHNHSAPLSLVVGVPFSILAVLAAALVIAIATVLILWRLRKRRRRAYAFQRMTFNEIDDDDEKD